ncbi:hypothetical protein [Tumebacillus algifaecis]|uniref:hypothetical protein n=1 Tax=Tumebacillus algifaecis TaxID=1214604 RepID=UPI0012FE7893|nr:hypothetical protein [Tumebacillus algifaecis]
MQFTKRLGLFLALAFLVTACGSEESKQQVGKLPEQVVQLPEQEQTQQEAEQTDQEPQPPDDKKEAEQQPTTDPATPSKPANEAPASNGTSTPPATSTKTPSGGEQLNHPPHQKNSLQATSTCLSPTILVRPLCTTKRLITTVVTR